MNRDEIQPQAVDYASASRRNEVIVRQDARGAHSRMVIALKGDTYPIVSGPLCCRTSTGRSDLPLA